MFRRGALLAAMIVLAASTISVTEAAATGPVASTYTALSPVRVLDTRTGAAVGAGQSVVVDLSARIPAGATAVVLNVTATNPTAGTHVTVWPADSARPGTSNLNVVAGETRPNLVTVRLGPTRRVSLFNANGSVDLLADLAGYYAPGSGSSYLPLPPYRVLDTRDGTGVGTPNSDGSVPLNLSGAVPAHATAVTFNLTATNVTASTHITASPHPRCPT